MRYFSMKYNIKKNDIFLCLWPKNNIEIIKIFNTRVPKIYMYIVVGFQNINRVFDLRKQSITEH